MFRCIAPESPMEMSEVSPASDGQAAADDSFQSQPDLAMLGQIVEDSLRKRGHEATSNSIPTEAVPTRCDWSQMSWQAAVAQLQDDVATIRDEQHKSVDFLAGLIRTVTQNLTEYIRRFEEDALDHCMQKFEDRALDDIVSTSIKYVKRYMAVEIEELLEKHGLRRSDTLASTVQVEDSPAGSHRATDDNAADIARHKSHAQAQLGPPAAGLHAEHDSINSTRSSVVHAPNQSITPAPGPEHVTTPQQCLRPSAIHSPRQICGQAFGSELIAPAQQPSHHGSMPASGSNSERILAPRNPAGAWTAFQFRQCSVTACDSERSIIPRQRSLPASPTPSSTSAVFRPVSPRPASPRLVCRGTWFPYTTVQEEASPPQGSPRTVAPALMAPWRRSRPGVASSPLRNSFCMCGASATAPSSPCLSTSVRSIGHASPPQPQQIDAQISQKRAQMEGACAPAVSDLPEQGANQLRVESSSSTYVAKVRPCTPMRRLPMYQSRPVPGTNGQGFYGRCPGASLLARDQDSWMCRSASR
eukprot:TRINITY_DN27574_c0_g1_i1.p1 TRINITY_DN27574_c0_g1~~TRINITY_DN27574_c0_g1_i1.p1  ORF type:complete len:529 (-),score=62.10 TRINITY_DN27574_c0_g1_i1:67-1653(-)